VGRVGREGPRKEEIREGKRKNKREKEGRYSHFTFVIHFQSQGVVLPNIFLTREAGTGKPRHSRSYFWRSPSPAKQALCSN
jgi:hypothetical protein